MILLTGDRGRIGRVVRAVLEAAGHVVRGFDLADGDDITDAAAVLAAAEGATAVVHLAGLPDDRGADPTDVMRVNLLGTFNVLQAARRSGVERVVHASSGKALGMAERPPAYLPIDDAHPGLPSRPYGLAKWLSEELCQAFTADTGTATICLRPVFVVCPDDPPRPPAPPDAPWDLGVWVDVHDVADAVLAALRCPDPGHTRLLLCADDLAGDGEESTLELVRRHLPDVPWRGGADHGWRSRRAVVDCSAAHRVLGWRPARRWADRAVTGRP